MCILLCWASGHDSKCHHSVKTRLSSCDRDLCIRTNARLDIAIIVNRVFARKLVRQKYAARPRQVYILFNRTSSSTYLDIMVETDYFARSQPPAGPFVTVYLIRHGQSLGQKACRKQRTHDVSLIDCALSSQGEFEATNIPMLLGSERYAKIKHVISSPLTRAVQTSLIGFPSKPITIHYDLYEMGGRGSQAPIPENRPRSLREVLGDTGGKQRVDGTTFAPRTLTFPKSHERLTNSERKEKLRRVWPSLWQYCRAQNCRDVAVVCHYNVIRVALSNARYIIPENAIPIECRLYRSGKLEVRDVLINPVEELSAAHVETNEGNKQSDVAAEGKYDEDGYMIFD